jgi:hypothetical protein
MASAVGGFVYDYYTHAPIANATISISYLQQTKTDNNGYYFLYLLGPGTYTITCSASGYKTQSKQFEVQEGKTASVDFALEPVTLPKATVRFQVYEEESLNIIPNATITIAGQKFITKSDGYTDPIQLEPNTTYDYTASAEGYYDTKSTITTGGPGSYQAVGVPMRHLPYASPTPTPTKAVLTFTVLDSDTNAPIQAAAVSVYSNTTSLRVNKATDANGVVYFELDPDSYRYSSGKEGYETTDGQIGYLEAGKSYSLTIKLKKKVGPAEVEVEVREVKTGYPIKGATVTFTNTETNASTKQTTDEKGLAYFTLDPGTYKYVVSASGYSPTGGTVTLGPGSSISITAYLTPTGGIGEAYVRFSVGDSITNAPIQGATVRIAGKTLVTDAQGNTEALKVDAPGSYDYTVEASGYETVTGKTEMLEPGKGYLIPVKMVRQGIPPIPVKIPWWVWVAAGGLAIGGILIIKAATSKPTVTVVMPGGGKE